MTAHISPDELWFALGRYKDGGWTDEEIFEQLKLVVISRCKNWLVKRNYIGPEDNPMTEYIHLHFFEKPEDEAIVRILRRLDQMDSSHPISDGLWLGSAIALVGLSGETAQHLEDNRPSNKVNEDLQVVIDDLVSDGCSFAELKAKLRSISGEVEGSPDFDDYYFDKVENKNKKLVDALFYKDRTGKQCNIKFYSLGPYYDRALKKYN